ncbi:hypothetical protein AWZ03_011898 [Drosophila navojoa]|uniref:Uncharacterized protein n=1 Tax=Drosophila navojoa TaxID=7232 RepID=A0A484AZ38_DRONA|nr:hypothetical protein AWZ03_011898 [Drosophila navojoa]
MTERLKIETHGHVSGSAAALLLLLLLLLPQGALSRRNAIHHAPPSPQSQAAPAMAGETPKHSQPPERQAR